MQFQGASSDNLLRYFVAKTVPAFQRSGNLTVRNQFDQPSSFLFGSTVMRSDDNCLRSARSRSTSESVTSTSLRF